MFRGFREVRHHEVEEWSHRLDSSAEITSAESNWIPGMNTTENLDEGSRLLKEAGTFKPNHEVSAHVTDEADSLIECGLRAKAILEAKRAEKIAKSIESQKPELPKLRVDVERHLEVENTFTQMHVLKSETTANVQQAATTNNTADDKEPKVTKKWHFDDSHERYDERCGETLDVTLNPDGSYSIEWHCMCIFELETITAAEMEQWLNTEEILPDTNGYYGWGPLRGGYKVFGFFFRGKVGHVNMGIIEKLYHELKK